MLAERLEAVVAPPGYSFQDEPSLGSGLRVNGGTKIMKTADRSHGAIVPWDMRKSFS
jgi:hypothetical protein